jgi:cyclophilin family peptidyl-prolyl cis-trans isomerase
MSKRIFVVISLFALSVLFFGCEKANKKSTASKTPPQVKKGVAPVADPEVAVIEMEEPVYGKITIELYSNIAPEMVKRFKELAREGFYNCTTFHRINSAVIQGGDPLSKDDDPTNDGAGESDKKDVPAEFSDIQYVPGMVGAARTDDVNSANSQFFITLRRAPEFDGQYTVFGKVIDGLNNARTIAGAPRDGERPLEDIKIKSVTIQPKQ